MKACVRKFDGSGDTVVLEYDTETADMEAVNTFIDNLEKEMYGTAFDLTTGSQVDKATKENTDIAVLPAWCGG